MNGTKLESVQCVKDLDVTLACNLKFPQQCKDAAWKKLIECFINRNFSFTNDVVIEWNKLSPPVMQGDTINFKNKPDHYFNGDSR